MDETEVLRTVKEQKTNPYPTNLVTMCSTPDWERRDKNQILWSEPTDYEWSETMTYCHILDREKGSNGDYVYTVSLVFSSDTKDLAYNESIPLKDQFIDRGVPRRAIRFVEVPYQDDEHLPGAFRHPIELPSHLTPSAWLAEPKES
jgi:hypothetical protein